MIEIDKSILSDWEIHPFTVALKEACRRIYQEESLNFTENQSLGAPEHQIALGLAKLQGKQEVLKIILDREVLIHELDGYINWETEDDNREDKRNTQ
jgi:hypothetical protein